MSVDLDACPTFATKVVLIKMYVDAIHMGGCLLGRVLLHWSELIVTETAADKGTVDGSTIWCVRVNMRHLSLMTHGNSSRLSLFRNHVEVPIAQGILSVNLQIKQLISTDRRVALMETPRQVLRRAKVIRHKTTALHG